MIGRFVAAVCAALALGGCAISGGYPEAPVSVASDLGPLKAAYFGDAPFARYAAAAPADKMAIRNEIIYGRIAAYDAEFAQFQIDINRERVLGDGTADAIIAGTSAAATGFSAKATKTALTAVTSTVTGVKGAYDKDLFVDQAMASIFSLMASNRASILATIEANSTLDIVAYPLTKGLADAATYRDAGSIPGALAAIAEATGPKKKDAQNQKNAAFMLRFRDTQQRLLLQKSLGLTH